MGSHFSGITNKNKLPLSKSFFLCVYPKQKVVDNNIIKCFGSNAILHFDTGWEFCHQLYTDKCHKSRWNVDTLLQDLVPGLVTLNYG